MALKIRTTSSDESDPFREFHPVMMYVRNGDDEPATGKLTVALTNEGIELVFWPDDEKTGYKRVVGPNTLVNLIE